MTISGDYLFIGLVILAGMLTLIALKANLVLFRIGGALAWLTLGILLLTNQLGTGVSQPWTQALGLLFLVMTVAVLTLQMVTDIRHERSVRGSPGRPGASTSSWKEWGPNPGKGPKLTTDQQSQQRLLDHRKNIHQAVDRGTAAARNRRRPR